MAMEKVNVLNVRHDSFFFFCNVSRPQGNPEAPDHLHRKFISYNSSRYLYKFLTGSVNRLVG